MIYYKKNDRFRNKNYFYFFKITDVNVNGYFGILFNRDGNFVADEWVPVSLMAKYYEKIDIFPWETKDE